MLFLFVILLLPVPCHAAPGASYIVTEASSGMVLCGENENIRLPMASTTKIMTALVVLEHTTGKERVEISRQSAAIEGSKMYLNAGETYTVDDLLCGLMLVSGNDAADALACFVAGSEEKFALLMDQKASEIGLDNTRFKNASGLDADGHFTTAFDLAKLTAVALQNEKFARIVRMKTCDVAGKTLVNHNKLLFRIDGCIGVKTGYTKKSGRCLVSAVQKDGVTLICVTLDCPDDWARHSSLYREQFERCKLEKVLDEKKVYLAQAIAGGPDIGCFNRTVYGVVTDGKKDIRYDILKPRFSYIGVKKGDVVGTLVVYNGETPVARAPLFADRDARAYERKRSLFKRLLAFLRRKQ